MNDPVARIRISVYLHFYHASEINPSDSNAHVSFELINLIKIIFIALAGSVTCKHWCAVSCHRFFFSNLDRGRKNSVRYTIFFLFLLIQMNSTEQLQAHARNISSRLPFIRQRSDIADLNFHLNEARCECLAFAFSKKKNACNFFPRETETIKLPEYKLHLFSSFLPLLSYIYPSLESIILGLTPHPDPCCRTSASETFEWTCTRLVEDSGRRRERGNCFDLRN